MEVQEDNEEISIIKPKYFAEYYKDGNLVFAHELNDIKEFNDDCDRTKKFIKPPFDVKLAKYIKEEISSRTYNKPIKDN